AGGGARIDVRAHLIAGLGGRASDLGGGASSHGRLRWRDPTMRVGELPVWPEARGPIPEAPRPLSLDPLQKIAGSQTLGLVGRLSLELLIRGLAAVEGAGAEG